jgi:hypothetical protein
MEIKKNQMPYDLAANKTQESNIEPIPLDVFTLFSAKFFPLLLLFLLICSCNGSFYSLEDNSSRCKKIHKKITGSKDNSSKNLRDHPVKTLYKTTQYKK